MKLRLVVEIRSPRRESSVPYLIASAVAAVLILCLLSYQWYVVAKVKKVVRQGLAQVEAVEREPAGGSDTGSVTADLEDFGMEVPGSLQRQIGIADLLANTWFVWMPLIVIACLAVAWMIPPPSRTPVSKSVERSADFK